VSVASLAARSQPSRSASAAVYTTTLSPSVTSSIVEGDESPSPTAPSPDDEPSSPSPTSPSPEPPSAGGTTTGGSTGGITAGGAGGTTSTDGGGGGGGGSPAAGSTGRVGSGSASDDVIRRRQRTVARDDMEREDSTGRVQWKQGAYWIMVEPPAVEGERQRNVQYSRRPFWGVRKVTGNPEQTFARQGKPPREFLYEMGVTRASIHSYERPHLRWRQTSHAKRRRGRII
jgi:hypothetical protein